MSKEWKNNINEEIEVYKNITTQKEHEKKLIEIIESENQLSNQHILDVGCASGNFIHSLREKFSEIHLDGFDISEDLIDLAKKRNLDKCNFFVSDIKTFDPNKKYDIIIASGVMSYFEDFIKPMERWLSWLNKIGKLYIFGRFNSHDIDTIIYHRNNYHDNPKWTGGLTSYSIGSVSRFLDQKSVKYEFIDFNLSIDLDKKDNPITTYSIMTENGKKIILNGANIIAEQFFLSISKTNN